MSIIEKLNAVQQTIPKYWPMSTFISRNPLLGFENLHFKEALQEAKKIFGGNVYMDVSYYINLYNKKEIDTAILDKNLQIALKGSAFEAYQEEAKSFMINISPLWHSLKNYEALKINEIDTTLQSHLEKNTNYLHKDQWIEKLTNQMTLYEIHDALFGTSDTELIEKDIIEYIARYLDQEQTTLSMEDRDLGMFNAFKLYEEITFDGDAESYVKYTLKKLQVQDIQAYFLAHLLKLRGWAGFIKYRSEDSTYHSQKVRPSSMMDYIAIRLHFEVKYMQKENINNFKILQAYIESNQEYVILKLLQSRGKLTGSYNDAMEEGRDYQKILDAYIKEEINLNALQIQLAKKELPSLEMDYVTFSDFVYFLQKEEGYIWLKSHEDTYIAYYTDELTTIHSYETKPLASAIFCLDVRSEVMRRKIEEVGSYETYGVGGFLGMPVTFVPFDKSHELFLAPAIVKPDNILFEIPTEAHEEYNRKKGIMQTTKKVLSDLKNNPYTPYIMVESIGWLFGIKLFGKTFFPQKTEQFFNKFKPKKPQNTFTLNKLNKKEIEKYLQRLYSNIINEVLTTQSDTTLNTGEVTLLYRHLVFNEELTISLPNDIIQKLKSAYNITPEDYQIQKEKLSKVGFTTQEQTMYLENMLKMIGLIDNFPSIVTIIGHGSCSDNNPFESSLDCGACSGSISLPNTRALCMIANKKEIREALKEKGIHIPEDTIFIPGLHTTTTDEINFYDTAHLDEKYLQLLDTVQSDFKKASQLAREERVKSLPQTNTHEDIFLKTMDWSEPRPEWGLSKNMGVFAGPRDTSKHLTFSNRFFMHSYDWTIDNDNADILTRIFDGPLVVGEWINLEYYFSTVDNKTYGAGSKVYHNVVSKIGVYNGNYSDLKTGLPMQSVISEGEAYHEPVRLLTFMEAPLEKVGKAVENSLAQPFILNEWIRPVIIDKEAKKVYSYENGEFIVIKELD